jgi:leucyl/phenylalanyl-tRNA--protein transferase
MNPAAVPLRHRPVLNDQQPWFPDPRRLARGELGAAPLAVGGDLSPARLLLAYRHGLFPWTVNPVTWWSPDPRGVLFFEDFHVSRSLARTLRRQPFTITVNRAFRAVIEGCALAPRKGQWITPEFIDAYDRLHRLGHAHSVECWQGDRLKGGIYGVAVGGVFSGESMFHLADDASKVALAHLVGRLRERGFAFLDVQTVTETTRKLGAKAVTREEFLRRLDEGAERDVSFV